jgi:hypothetical protein
MSQTLVSVTPRGRSNVYDLCCEALAAPVRLVEGFGQGSCLGARLLTTTTMATQCDRIIATLHRRLDTSTDEILSHHRPGRHDF